MPNSCENWLYFAGKGATLDSRKAAFTRTETGAGAPRQRGHAHAGVRGRVPESICHLFGALDYMMVEPVRPGTGIGHYRQ